MDSVAPPDAAQLAVDPMMPRANVAPLVTDQMVLTTDLMVTMASTQTVLAIVAAVNLSVAMVSAIVTWSATLVTAVMTVRQRLPQRRPPHRQLPRQHRRQLRRQQYQLVLVDASRAVEAGVMVVISALELEPAPLPVMTKAKASPRVAFCRQLVVAKIQYARERAHLPCVRVRQDLMQLCS